MPRDSCQHQLRQTRRLVMHREVAQTSFCLNSANYLDATQSSQSRKAVHTRRTELKSQLGVSLLSAALQRLRTIHANVTPDWQDARFRLQLIIILREGSRPLLKYLFL